MKKEVISIFLFIMVFILITKFSLSIEENISLIDKAENCLEESRIILETMLNDGFSVERINDTLEQAQDLFIAQLAKEKEKKGTGDFDLVLNYCNKILEIKELAYLVRDEFEALIKFYNDVISEEMDTKEIDNLIEEIKEEIKNERYEVALNKIEEAYDEIADLEAEYSALRVYYRATTKTLKNFFKNNWKIITIVVSILVILIIIFRRQILMFKIKRKIKRLELRKNILKNLIKETQKEYFELGKISETTYNIRIKKFGELIREIDREIPLLIEKLAKLERKKVKNYVKK